MAVKKHPNKNNKKLRVGYPALILSICLLALAITVIGYYVVDKNTKSIGKFLERETVFSFFTNQSIAYITVFNENFQISLPSLTKQIT